jgi:hypothetical protein
MWCSRRLVALVCWSASEMLLKNREYYCKNLISLNTVLRTIKSYVKILANIKYASSRTYSAWPITCSALALSTVLRTTSLSYGNMPFSGTHPTKTPWPIVLKLCTVDYVGEATEHAKNGYNRLAIGGSPYRWNISIYTLLYLTLPYFTIPFFVSLPSLQTRPLNRFLCAVARIIRFCPRKCLFGVSLNETFIRNFSFLPFRAG